MITSALHRAADWAKSVFSSAALGDPRRTARLVNVAAQLAKYSGKSITISSEGSKAMQEGAYRFIRNPNVSAEAIRKAGAMQTVKLAQEFPELLAIEDTTSLSYRHQVAEELGKLGSIQDKSRGWWVHSVLLLEATTFRTVGLLHQEWWMRPDDPADADEKESGKWLAAAATSRLRMGSMMSNVIAVCDREADIHAYLQDKLAHNERFVVRSKHPRKDVESGLYLYDHLKNQPELGGYQISIPQKGVVDKRGKRKNRPARKASLSLRSGRITLKQGNITLNAVLAEEINPPKGETPLKWLLLTSEPVESLAQALRVIDIYTHRWRIEEFHKAWKTGAGAERQRMEEPDNLERMVSILSFVAVRLLQLRESFTPPQALRAQGLLKEAEHVESQSAETVLTPDECQLLGYLDKGKRKRKEKAGSLQWAYMAIARLGGFMDSKRTGIASWGALWEGWEALQSKLDGFLAAKDLMAQGIKICITGDALVALPEGESVRIADIVPGARPNSDNAIDLKVLDRHGNPVLADRLFHSGEHPVYTVRTVEGLRVTGTANHPLLCLVDVAGVPTLLWKLIDEIKPGDYAVIQRSAFSVDCAGFARGKPEFAPTTYTVGVPGLVRFLEAHHRDPDAQAIADELTDGRFYYAKVASVTDAGVQPVYSLRVDTADHAFITNGFVSHALEVLFQGPTGLTGLNSGLTTNPGVSAWQVNTAYTAGQLVTYNGKTYKCLQPHTSLAGWEPSNVPALWQLQLEHHHHHH